MTLIIKIGALFQYQDAHYAKCWSTCPGFAFAQPSLRIRTAPFDEKGRKKYVILPTKKKTVHHFKVPEIQSDYYMAFISDPYLEGDTLEGWIRADWVEPMTEIETYDLERLKKAQEAYLGLKNTEPPGTGLALKKTWEELRWSYRERGG